MPTTSEIQDLMSGGDQGLVNIRSLALVVIAETAADHLRAGHATLAEARTRLEWLQGRGPCNEEAANAIEDLDIAIRAVERRACERGA